MEVSQENIKIARFVAGAIGFEPHVYPYFDNDKVNQIDILSLKDPIDENVAIYCSIGLSDHTNLVQIGEKQENIAIELLLAAYKEFQEAPNVLSTCCFYIIKDRYECRPGAVFMHMNEFYFKDSDMRHIFFTTPFLWQDKLEGLSLESKKVEFLLCIPISENELQFKIDKGDEALESLLHENEIDIYDLSRKSVL